MRKIVQTITPWPEYPASPSTPVLQYDNSSIGATFCLRATFRKTINRGALPSIPKISGEIQAGLSGEAL